MIWLGCIYALRDPRTMEIRYIGQTDNPSQRKLQHLLNKSRCNRDKRRWILELRLLGLRPVFEVLEECELYQMNDRERYWIGCLERTNRLLNKVLVTKGT